jgi:internalin A
LSLHGNDGLGIPPEFLGPTWEDLRDRKKKPAAPWTILDYYFRTRKASERRALNEVKVILVGQGSVGKTSLVKRIVYDTFSPGEEKTEGIYIEREWSVPGRSQDEKVQVNFWDFGGQEIMHATHQFFLTKRTLYLLVLDARKGENESNLHYWLKIVASFGGNSPILVVTNKCEQYHLDLNETRLKKDYPGIRGFFETSCEKATGIAELKAAVEREIRAMPHVYDLLPIEYFTVKKELESLAARCNHITTRDYYALCVQHGIRDLREQDALLRSLHDLGSVLSFNDPDNPYALRETSVLNPEWVTQGVYQILNKQNAAECNGVLTKADLSRILGPNSYPESCHRFIIDMMQKFELCFVIEEHEQWLVPELLNENEPEGLDTEQKGALNLQYHYQVLPSGIICRFIVRRYENLAKPPVCWRSGVMLHFDGCSAVVRSDKDKGRMFIAVTGPEKCRRGFLALLRQEFSSIHATIPNLHPDERVPLPDTPPDKPEVTVSYKHLLRLEQAREPDVWPEGAEHSYTVAQLLDGIEDKLIRGWNCFGYCMLMPPLFVVEPETTFPDAWEVFCCDVLNRHHKTTGIYQRKPPEGGVDLYWPEKKTAYQCKSVEDGGGRFNVTKALASIDAALETRKRLRWEKYALCSNVLLTGDQERKLREKLGDEELELLTPSFWQPRCLEQREYLRGRFNILARTDERGELREID